MREKLKKENLNFLRNEGRLCCVAGFKGFARCTAEVSLGNGGLFFCSSVLPGGPQAGRLKWSRYSTYRPILTLLSVLIFVSFIDCSALEGSIMILWYAYNKKKKSTVINERFTSVFFYTILSPGGKPIVTTKTTFFSWKKGFFFL